MISDAGTIYMTAGEKPQTRVLSAAGKITTDKNKVGQNGIAKQWETNGIAAIPEFNGNERSQPVCWWQTGARRSPVLLNTA